MFALNLTVVFARLLAERPHRPLVPPVSLPNYLTSQVTLNSAQLSDAAFSSPLAQPPPGTLSLVRCSFFGCVIASGDAGAVHLSNLVLFVRTCQFRENRANAGGALTISISDTVRISACLFSGNQAADRAGAAMLSSVVNFQVLDAVFYENSCKLACSSIYLSQCQNALVLDTRLLLNECHQSGTIVSDHSVLKLSGLLFAGNVCPKVSAFSSTGSSIVIKECRFQDRSASSLELSESDRAIISLCHFSGDLDDEIIANRIGLELVDNVWHAPDVAIELPKLGPIPPDIYGGDTESDFKRDALNLAAIAAKYAFVVVMCGFVIALLSLFWGAFCPWRVVEPRWGSLSIPNARYFEHGAEGEPFHFDEVGDTD
jgi:hypothetical protein